MYFTFSQLPIQRRTSASGLGTWRWRPWTSWESGHVIIADAPSSAPFRVTTTRDINSLYHCMYAYHEVTRCTTICDWVTATCYSDSSTAI